MFPKCKKSCIWITPRMLQDSTLAPSPPWPPHELVLSLTLVKSCKRLCPLGQEQKCLHLILLLFFGRSGLSCFPPISSKIKVWWHFQGPWNYFAGDLLGKGGRSWCSLFLLGCLRMSGNQTLFFYYHRRPLTYDNHPIHHIQSHPHIALKTTSHELRWTKMY